MATENKSENSFDSSLEKDKNNNGMNLRSSFRKKKIDLNFNEFESPNFMIQTSSSYIANINSECFNSYDANAMKGGIICVGQNKTIEAIAAHPNKPYLVISGNSGNIHIWDYENKEIVKVSLLNGLITSCISFDPKGEYLVIGGTNGVIKFFEASAFIEISAFSFKPSKASIKNIKFSHDSLFIAFTDSDK
jgi:WD40 repeat protein